MQESGHSAALSRAIEIVPFDPRQRDLWNSFCLQCDEAWFWHTTQWLDYTLSYRPDLSPSSMSFLVFHEKNLAAICPLVLETYREDSHETRQFSFGGDAVPSPAFANALSPEARSHVRNALLQHVDEVALHHQVQRISWRTSPIAPLFWETAQPGPNPLLHRTFLDISLLSRVINLDLSEEQLFRDMRKGHRAAIKRAQKIMTASVLDHTNIDADHFERYRLLHHKAAGRVTRPLQTFQMMQRWIEDGLAVLCYATLEDNDIGFALINVYKHAAYYSSGCTDPGFAHLPIGHLLQWRVMQWLKQHQVQHYEIGIQHYESKPYSLVSEKEWNISFFKRGFGGRDVSLWRAEKFYDEQLSRKILHQRDEQLAQHQPPPKTRSDK